MRAADDGYAPRLQALPTLLVYPVRGGLVLAHRAHRS